MDTRPPVVLVHGLWMTPRSWEGWVERYRNAGHQVLAPSWPGFKGEVEELRRDRSSLRNISMKQTADHYEGIIRALDQPPVIMGHSLGGIVTQLLVDRGLGCAAVAIAPGQPAGVPVLPWSTVRSGFSVLGNPFTFFGAPDLSPGQFHYAFCNHLDAAGSRKVYDRYCIPAAARMLWEAALSIANPWGFTRVNAANSRRAPMLFVAGSIDHVVPPVTVKAIVRKYARASSAVTEYREYPGRTHFLAGQEGWEEIADDALAWAMRQARRSGAEPSVAGSGL